jgi:hypothetical protein
MIGVLYCIVLSYFLYIIGVLYIMRLLHYLYNVYICIVYIALYTIKGRLIYCGR